MPFSGALPFAPSHVEGGGTPNVRAYVLKASEPAVVRGTVMTINAGEVDEFDTDDVTLIVGVAAAGDQSAYGYGIGDSPTTVTGRANTIPIWLAGTDVVFYGQLSNGTTALVAPDAANVGVSYGLIKQQDGRVTVDEADTTNVVVRVIGFDTTQNSPGRVYFKFLSSTLYVP